MTHLSRLSEELILWMSPSFGFIDTNRFVPVHPSCHKKRIRNSAGAGEQKTGRVNGHLVALLTLMKAQPLAYNKDNQEKKEPLFDTVDTLTDTLRIYADMLTGVRAWHPDAMREMKQSAVMRGYRSG